MNALLARAGERIRPLQPRAKPFWPSFATSAAVHGLLIGAVVAWTLLGRHRLPPPTEPPQIDVVLDGGGAHATGAPPTATPSPPLAATPPAEVPPEPTAAVPSPPMPPAQMPQQAPPQPPLPQQVAGLTPLPPAQPIPVAQPLPPMPPPPLPQPPLPEPARAQKVSLRPPPSPDSRPEPQTEIRLGDGVAGPLAEVLDGQGIIHAAKADNGNIPPAYPLDAARRGEQGEVTLRLTIGTDGSVLEAEVAKSSGSPRLDRAARTGIALWHFKPALRDGKPQLDVIEMGVEFVMN